MVKDVRGELVMSGFLLGCAYGGLSHNDLFTATLLFVVGFFFVWNNWRLSNGKLPLGKTAVKWLAEKMNVIEKGEV